MTDDRRTIHEPFGGWTDEQRHAVCRWVEQHAVDPSTVPADGGVHLGEIDVEFDVIQHDDDGHPIVAGDTFATTTVRKPLVAPWPL